MLSKTLKILCFSLFCLLATHTASFAQKGANDTLMLGGIVVEGDTFAMVFLDNVTITDKLPRKYARKRRKYNKLRNNVYKVYPYAVIAADVLKGVDDSLLAIGDDKDKRKEYLKSIEKELRSRFKGELEDMTVSQGHLLVKLIDRQTGKNCYNIIKELKGGFSAVIIQSVAVLFTHNLKREYDPDGEDSDIEQIVRELEANYNYEYQYRQQQSHLSQSRTKS